MSAHRVHVENVIKLLKTHPNHRALFVFLRAYAFGYAITAGPRMVFFWIDKIIKYHEREKRLRKNPKADIVTLPRLAWVLFEGSIRRVIWRLFHIRGFAMFFAMGLGSGQLLEELLLEQTKKKKDVSATTPSSSKSQSGVLSAHDSIVPSVISQHQKVATTFVTASIASSFSLYYLHRISPQSATKTIDLTLFAIIRAFDVLVRFFYQECMSERFKKKWIPKWLTNNADSVVFAISCYEIMFAWFYAPQRLPKTYVQWINRMSGMDPRLLEALRLIRKNKYVYGLDTGYAHLLGDYAYELGLDRKLGDPANGQIPCLVVHGNMTQSCEVHGSLRWIKGFLMALRLYLPVHLIPPLLFRPRQLLKRPLFSALHIAIATTRSASFLATFIASMWYSCCLMRTRIGPTLLPQTVNRVQLDKLGPLFGCFLCGFSLFFENKRRRGEMALYVAPRALYSFWTRLVGSKEWWKQADTLKEVGEIGMFGVAMGIVVTAMKYRKGMVRPMVRGVLGWILDV